VKSLCFHTVASIIWAPLISVASMFVVLLFGLNDCVECPPLGSLIIIYLTSPISIHQGVLAYWGIALAGEGIRYYRDMRSEKLRVTELSAQLNAAQLSALKMQIHPHFLFNTLNSIVTLINEDPATAERMILKLSNFLRMTLQSSGEPMVTLKQEFDFLRTYLDIEKVRFGDRLMTEFVYDDALLAAKIPNLLLQPLVENSIRHGINNKKSGGLINISAERNNGSLVITITDNGKVIGRGEGGTSCGGLGLKNTTERLMNIYGDDHEFEIAGNELEGTTVRVTVPYRT
jgi:LytS/YehU family sensor histidine kinase